MKTLFTIAMAGLLATSTLASNSNEDLMALSTASARFKKVNVLLKEGIGKAKVAILDEDGKMLHQRKVNVKDQQVIVPYDLNEMPCGEYQVKITTEDEEVTYKVETFERKKIIDEYPLAAYGKKVDDQTINLSVFGLTEPGVRVKVRHEDSDAILHSERINVSEGFTKDFKLQGLSPEEVYLEVTDSKGRMKILHF